MATDNFLDKKSVLGLAERVPMCPPPETIVFSDKISWVGSSLSNLNQYQYANNISILNVTNFQLVANLALGQSVACQITIQGEVETLPLFLTKRLTNSTGTTGIVQNIAKGVTVLDNGKIAGVIFTHMVTISGLSRTTLSCQIYIHDWGTI